MKKILLIFIFLFLVASTLSFASYTTANIKSSSIDLCINNSNINSSHDKTVKFLNTIAFYGRSQPTLSKSASVTSVGQENTIQKSPLTLENMLVLGGEIYLITTHGNMATEYSEPHITQTDPLQFVVILKNIKPGKYPINQKIHFDTGLLESDLVIFPDQKGLKFVFTLRYKAKDFHIGISHGDTIIISFSS